MSDALRHYATIADTFHARVGGITADQWDQPVPSCPEWTVRDLVEHVIGTHHNILGTLGQAHAAPADDADLVPLWQAATTAVRKALGDGASADRRVKGPFGKQPFSELTAGLLSNDTIFHTWDLARATGQDTTLDVAACERTLANMEPLDEVLRSPGLFSAKLPVAADADAQSKLLAFGGRQN